VYVRVMMYTRLRIPYKPLNFSSAAIRLIDNRSLPKLEHIGQNLGECRKHHYLLDLFHTMYIESHPAVIDQTSPFAPAPQPPGSSSSCHPSLSSFGIFTKIAPTTNAVTASPIPRYNADLYPLTGEAP